MSPGRPQISEQYQGTAAYIVQHSILPNHSFFRIIHFTTFLLFLQIQAFQASPDTMCKDHENGFATLTEQNQKHWELVFSFPHLPNTEFDVSALALLIMTQRTCSNSLQIHREESGALGVGTLSVNRNLISKSTTSTANHPPAKSHPHTPSSHGKRT